MLQEPEEGIADDVVVAMIGFGRRYHKSHLELRIGTMGRNQGFTVDLCPVGPGAVALAHRGRDPDGFLALQYGAHRGNEAPMPLTSREFPSGNFGKRDRPS